METFFLAVLVVIMIVALASGYPVAFALPGSAIIAIGLAAFFWLHIRGRLQCLFCCRWTYRIGSLLVLQILGVITGM